jgi:hypothetical protein
MTIANLSNKILASDDQSRRKRGHRSAIPLFRCLETPLTATRFQEYILVLLTVMMVMVVVSGRRSKKTLAILAMNRRLDPLPYISCLVILQLE